MLDPFGAASFMSSARPTNPEPLSFRKARQLNRDISSATGPPLRLPHLCAPVYSVRYLFSITAVILTT